ncbi:MAG: hemolysin family protein [Bacteroidales bacterium]|nr:hemolysin family protein [Bacteroidales bacterium]MDD3990059.1 hemolysin family protein [Bacteroidales bacterium]
MITSVIIMAISLAVIAIIAALRKALQCYNLLLAEVDKKQGRRYAEAIGEIMEEKRRYAGTAAATRTLFTLIFSVTAAAAVMQIFPGFFLPFTWLGLVILITSILVALVVFGEIIPFLFATVNPDGVLKNLYWFAVLLLKISPEKHNVTDVEDIASESATGSGDAENTERGDSKEIEIFQRALEFPDVILRECLIPRTEIAAVEESLSFSDLVSVFSETNYSRIIVYKESIDHITGYVHSKDLFAGSRPVKELIREIDYYPESAKAQEVLAMLIKNKSSIAVVLDEFGGTAGIVTLEDLIEEIFGEISDELDSDDLTEKELPDGGYIFSGRLEVKYINRRYDLEIPESEEYETLSGFITYHKESIPSEGEEVVYGNMHFRILKTTSNRIESLSLRIVEQ